MSTTDYLLCVGGPRDGEFVSVNRWRTDYVVPVLKMNFMCFSDLLQPDDPGSLKHKPAIETFVYNRRIWRSGDEVTSLLVPESQTDAEIMKMLIANYRPQ